MITRISRWGSRAACVALISASLSGCSFTDPISSDPNAVPDATVDQLFTAIQVTTYLWTGGHLSRLMSVWQQQMDGTDRQFASYAQYNAIDETHFEVEWQLIYGQGGLEDIKKALVRAGARDDRIYEGIIKVHQAFQMGMAASVWGDIPFTTAGEPDATLDEQFSVYDRMQAILDEAISDLSSGQGTGPGSVDFNFGGTAAPWIAVAHSLKARFHMHLAEVQGSSAYNAALSEAQQGISSSLGNWYQIHALRSQENNLWFQFQKDRSGYIQAGEYLVDWLQDRADPRLSLYYSKGTGAFSDVYIGSPPGNPAGDPGPAASNLSSMTGAPDYDLAITTCAETQFIIAEAQFALGNEAAALAAANAGIDCSETEWGVSLAAMPGGLSGSALFAEIMEQKYVAMFLNAENWNDYKRTCLPDLETFDGLEIPPRPPYPGNERQTNPNVPAPSDQPLRNDNDPNPC